MNKRIKVIAFIAITAFMMVLPLGAQQSNLSKSTAEVFGNEVDDFMDVNSYEDAGFEKWFGVADGGSEVDGFRFGSIGLGYATKALPVYVGAYFSGNIVYSRKYYYNRLATAWNLNLMEWTSKTETDYYYDGYNYNYFNNDLSVLIGVAGIGIKVGLIQMDYRVVNSPLNAARNTTTTTTSNPNGTVVTKTNVQEAFDRREGLSIMPLIEAGMNVNAGGLALSPYIRAGFGFYKDLLVDEWRSSVTEYAEGLAPITSDDRLDISGYSKDAMLLAIAVGTGIDLNDNMSLGFEYGFFANLYSNDYNLLGNKGNVKGTVSWNDATYPSYTTTTTTLDYTEVYETGHLTFTEKTQMLHLITPSFGYRVDVTENFKLGATVSLPITIENETEDFYTVNFSKETLSYNDPHLYGEGYTYTEEGKWQGNIENTSILGIAAEVGIGATGTVGKFTLSGGFKIKPFDYTSTTTKTKYNAYWSGSGKTEYNDGTVDELARTDLSGQFTVTDDVYVRSTYAGFSGSVGGGFGFAFNENVEMDFHASYGFGYVDWSQVNVMFKFKF